MAGGSDPALKRVLLKARSRVGAMTNSDRQEALSPPPHHLTQIRTLEVHGTQHLGNPMSMNMRDESVRKRCVPTLRQTGARPMAVGTWRTNYPMAMGMQRTGIRPMAVGARCSGDNLGTEATHSY